MTIRKFIETNPNIDTWYEIETDTGIYNICFEKLPYYAGEPPFKDISKDQTMEEQCDNLTHLIQLAIVMKNIVYYSWNKYYRITVDELETKE